ncbi:MAG: hypothetical protein HZB38_02805 [Planctomycetes bacterium]|nr:hypothetical protein [Planctomycetota bacterium]
MFRNRCTGTLGLFLLIAALDLRADVRNTLTIRLPPETLTPAVSGEEYAGTLEITAPTDGVLESLEIGGDGWLPLGCELDLPAVMRRGEAQRVPFRALVLNAAGKFEVRASFNGDTVLRRFSLSPEHIAQIGRPRPTVRVDDAGQPASLPGDDGPETRGCADQQIRVRGRFEYVRFDGQEIGGDGIHFQVMDQDDLDDEVMFESYTDTNGYFDVTICWDDCDATGCDDPDIYIYFDCETGAAIVRNDDAGEDTYAWSTEGSQIYNDYTGSDLDFGDIRPANAAEYTAVHIHNSVMRAHRFVLENNAYYTPQVIVVWQDQNGAFYRPPPVQEVHIGPDEQWNEGTQVHEWGHHLLHDWNDPPDPSYCNGFCDDPAVSNCGAEACMNGGGHCLWCNETDTDAWNEGFPDWLGSVVMRNWQARYGGAAPSAINDNRYTLEAVQNCCDGTAHNALTTEGFVAALLRDIDDALQDAGQTSCPQDCLALGSDEILSVVRNGRPLRVTEFITAFRAAFSQYEHDFRSTAQAVAPAYVAGWPIPPIEVQTTSGCGSTRVGGNVTLHVQTNASRYSTCMRWQHDGADVTDGGRISGATTESLTITNVQASDAGQYTLVIRSCDGSPNACDPNASQTVTSQAIPIHVFGASGPGHHITGWGRNDAGQLGRGTNVPGSDENPADVLNLTNAVAVSAGNTHSVAVLADGTAWSWGTHFLGNGTSADSATPVQVNDLADVVAAEANGWLSAMALYAHGHVWTCGSNYQGMLGYPVPNGIALIPGQVNLECVVDISMGRYHAAAVASDGSLWMWGTNYNGELGQGTTGGASETPLRVTDLTDVVDVDCGYAHTLALRADGTLWACGWNQYGQLGDGTFTSRNRFVQVTGLANVTSMAGGDYHSVARLSNGQAWAWGSNGSYELGTGGPQTNNPTPAAVINVGRVRAVDAGNYLSVFTAENGTIWTCGSNGNGQLGRPFDGTAAGYLPAPVNTSVGAGVMISAGTSFVMTIAPGARITAPLEDQLVPGCAAIRLTVPTVGEPPLNYQWGRIVAGLFVPLNESGGRYTGTTTPTLTVTNTEWIDSGIYQVQVQNATNNVFSNQITFSTPPPVNAFDTPQDADWFGNEGGNWAITDGAYAAGAPTIYQPTAYSSFDLPQSDFLAELDVVNASHVNFDTNGGIWLRSNSTALPYPRGVVLAFGEAYPWGGGDVYWHRNYGSGYASAENVAHNVYTAGQTLHLRIEVRGNTYTCWANDSQTPTTTFATPDFPAGRIALMDGVAAGTAFDNVFIQTLTNCDPGSGNEPVRIIQRPQSQTVAPGTLVTLSVAATGTGPLEYQWMHEGLCIEGATAPTYSFTAAAGAGGRFECTVTNACGSVGSFPAVVTVEVSGPPGDIDGDGHVSIADLTLLLSSFGMCEGGAGYNAGADLDGDDCVGLTDLAILLANFGA